MTCITYIYTGIILQYVHSIELCLMEISQYITHYHVNFHYQVSIDWIAIQKKNAHEYVIYQNDARSMPYKVAYANMQGKPGVR